MSQEHLKDFIRQRFDCREFLKKSSGCSLYICPKCGSPPWRRFQTMPL